MSEQVNQIIKELNELYKKAKTKEDYEKAIQKGKVLLDELEKEHWEGIAKGLNYLWGRYYKLLKFAPEGEAFEKELTKLLQDIEDLYHNISDSETKIEIIYLQSVSYSNLAKNIEYAEYLNGKMKRLIQEGDLPPSSKLRLINSIGLKEMAEKNWAKAVEIFSEINNFSMEELSTIENPDTVANIFSNLGASYVRGDINVTKGRENLLKAESYCLKAVTPSEKHLQGIKNRLREVEEKKSQLIVKKIIEDLSNRKGWSQIWSGIREDEETKEEIVKKWEIIVKEGNNPYFIVNQILVDLRDRRGLRQEWEIMDEQTQKDIKEKWIQIVGSIS